MAAMQWIWISAILIRSDICTIDMSEHGSGGRRMDFSSIAVTGAQGLIGREVVRELSEFADIKSLDISPGPVGKISHHVDVTDYKRVRNALRGVDAVVHLVGLQLVPWQEKIFEVNTVGTWNVFQAAKEEGIRKVVFLSSECATGIVTLTDCPRAIPDYLPIDEAHPSRPKDAYGVSKQLTEYIAQAFGRSSDMQVVALRPTSVFSPGMEPQMATARAGDDPYLWLYVEAFDVARAVRLALDYRGPAYDCFFVSARDTFAQVDTLNLVERTFGQLPEIRDAELYGRNPHATIYDISRAKDVLGFEPASNWRTYLKPYLERSSSNTQSGTRPGGPATTPT